MGNTLQTANRNYLWDNIKAFLILTVVVGHFLETFPLENIIFSGLDYWIYTFHMPVFLFVSGYWAKGYCKDGKVRSEKLANLIAYYAVFQVLFILVIKVFFSPNKTFSMFEPAIGLWYLVSMIAYYLMIPLAEKLPAYIVVPITIFLGLIIGCEPRAGTFMAISRTFVFAPFFFMGYYTQEKLITLLRNLKGRFFIGLASAAASGGICIAVLATLGREKFPMRLFYGKHNFEAMGLENAEGVLLRALAWIVGILAILAVIMLFPEKKNAISYLGKNSLQIYLFHFLLIIFFKLSDFTRRFPIETIWQGILLCLAGVAFTLFLSIPPLSKPFEWIQKGVAKLFTLPHYNGKK